MSLVVWSDYVCPFAYVGFRRLQRAGGGAGRPAVPAPPVEWRPFELHPETPPSGIPRDVVRRGAAERGATARPGTLRRLLDDDGLVLTPSAVQFNSRLALQAAEYARDHGCFDALHDRLFTAAFEEGADLGRPEVIGRLAGEVGLDGDDVVEAVTSWRHLDRVVEAVEDAMALGITGTPSYLLPDGTVLRGVQPVEVLEAALGA